MECKSGALVGSLPQLGGAADMCLAIEALVGSLPQLGGAADVCLVIYDANQIANQKNRSMCRWVICR